MTKTISALGALALTLMAGNAMGQTQSNILPAQRGTVFITRDDFTKALAARAAGSALGVVGAVRAGDDRINVDVLRRDTPDEAPVTHDVVTEIYYVLEGGGDFATGGVITDAQPMMTNGKPTNPASIGPSRKGMKVEGGTTRHVTAGDVVMLPPNVVHGFTKLDGHVTYMVVRVNPDYEKGR
jgi:mannose-6-phosphate isomerase-like protein (cupin superfamily)